MRFSLLPLPFPPFVPVLRVAASFLMADFFIFKKTVWIAIAKSTARLFFVCARREDCNGTLALCSFGLFGARNVGEECGVNEMHGAPRWPGRWGRLRKFIHRVRPFHSRPDFPIIKLILGPILYRRYISLVRCLALAQGIGDEIQPMHHIADRLLRLWL